MTSSSDFYTLVIPTYNRAARLARLLDYLEREKADFPIVEAAVGVTPRLQLGVSVPHIVGSADGTGPEGGVGTSYISGKIALLTGQSDVKLAVSPIIEILGKGAAQALAPDEWCGRSQEQPGGFEDRAGVGRGSGQGVGPGGA